MHSLRSNACKQLFKITAAYILPCGEGENSLRQFFLVRGISFPTTAQTSQVKMQISLLVRAHARHQTVQARRWSARPLGNVTRAKALVQTSCSDFI
jgi:hypothetical protein